MPGGRGGGVAVAPGGRGGGVAVAPGGGASGGVAITAYDTFVSCQERNAQYSTAFPYVKPRKIAKNRLVFPNCTLIENRRNRKVWPYPYT